MEFEHELVSEIEMSKMSSICNNISDEWISQNKLVGLTQENEEMSHLIILNVRLILILNLNMKLEIYIKEQ